MFDKYKFICTIISTFFNTGDKAMKKKYTWYRPRWWREVRVNIQLALRIFIKFKEKHPGEHLTEPERF